MHICLVITFPHIRLHDQTNYSFLKGNWLGHLPIFIKSVALNQYNFKITFLDPSPHKYWGWGCFGNMPSGFQIYWSIYMCINKQCSRVNTPHIWIETRHRQNKKMISVWVEIWTRISMMNNWRCSQLCHAVAQQIILK
jgi:hypothetical protein